MVVYVDPPAFPANVKVASAGGLANPYDINANIRTAIMALKDLLDGTESHGADFLFKPGATWDFIVQLGDAVGARKVIIRDSDGVDVAAIDSNGNITMLDSVITGYLDMTEIALPGNPAANALRLFVEDVKGFSFFSFRDENGMVRKIVRDSVFVGKNITGVAIAAMRAVYATGSADGVPTLGLAKADAAATMPAIGVTIETIADGAYGRVMQVGLLEGVNTNAFNAGDVIYVSAATAGGGTATPPTYPNMRQEIGTVLVKGIAGVGVFQCVARSVFNDAVIDHGALLGLGDDDHPQYMTPAEHTAIGDGVPHHAQLHNLLSTSHSDALPAAVLDGDVIIGNVTPAWSKLAISVPAANVRNVFGIDNAELRPSWKTALDAVNPADIAAAAGPGTSLLFSHRDHVHAHPNLGDLHTGYLLATGARAGASAQAQDFGALGIKADLGVESTLNAGVTIETVLLKDGGITFSIPEALGRDVYNSAIIIRGGVIGVVGGGAFTYHWGKTGAEPGAFWLATPNAAANADIVRLAISGVLATAVASWNNVTHTGLKLSGALDANYQGISSVGGMSIQGNTQVYSTDNNAINYFRGGLLAAGGGSVIAMHGVAEAGFPGRFQLMTPDAPGTGDVTRLTISGKVAVAVASWTNCKQLFDAASLPNGDPGVPGQLYYTAADGLVRRSA